MASRLSQLLQDFERGITPTPQQAANNFMNPMGMPTPQPTPQTGTGGILSQQEEQSANQLASFLGMSPTPAPTPSPINLNDVGAAADMRTPAPAERPISALEQALDTRDRFGQPAPGRTFDPAMSAAAGVGVVAPSENQGVSQTQNALPMGGETPMASGPVAIGNPVSASGMPLNEFLAGGTDPSRGLFRAPQPMAGRGETLSADEFNQLSQERQQRATDRMNQRSGPEAGMSERDAMGLTQGQRRNLLRSQGVSGSAQVVGAQQMGTQNDLAEAERAMEMQPNMSERERRVENLIDEMGISRTEALGLVEGTIRLSRDPDSGKASIINMVTGESRPVMEQGAEGESPTQPQDPSTATGARYNGQTLFEMADEVTGILPNVKDAVQGVAGQVGINVADPEVQAKRQFFTTERRNLIRALRESGRYVQGEVDAIEKEVDISTNWNVDPQTLKSRMKGIKTSLESRRDQFLKDSLNSDLASADRRSARTGALNIERFLDTMGEPVEEDKEGEVQGASGFSKADLDLINKYL